METGSVRASLRRARRDRLDLQTFAILARMPETVEFKSNGSVASGYLAKPPSGSGPGVLVIQEWWGLDSGIKASTDRLAAAGFVALAPDLFHGELAEHTEMDKASNMMQSMPPDRAARDKIGRASCRERV